ncbi:MAG: Gfo/Idh/MocA family oxidoreductase [Halanaerobiales bacterium]|nr:Gfo/Idh/MocA family oxidoreductase [Halanaerobiales bacterium]
MVKKIAVIGAGNRGKDVYSNLIKKNNNLEITAVAESQKSRREELAQEHNISPKNQFKDWEDLLFKDKLADAVIIATGDKKHFAPLTNALKKGYKVLCEKPITDDFKELTILNNEYNIYNDKVMVSHVLRYTPFFKKIKELISDNAIGDIRFINLIENIGFFHYAHSYVRGNWRNQNVGAPIILAKSCHDLDILYWLLESKVKRVYSESSDRYFNKMNDPVNSGERCLKCEIEKNCPYSAKKVYLRSEKGWPVSVITDDLSYEGRIEALRKSNYGKCVYKSDNDQLDVQSLLLKYENGISTHFALTAFSEEMTRKINIFGTHGEISGNLDQGIIEVKPFLSDNKTIEIDYKGGHAGGDEKLIEAFEQFLYENQRKNESTLISALESHFVALAAEKSRINKTSVKLDKFRG